jgi:hypothetical protein
MGVARAATVQKPLTAKIAKEGREVRKEEERLNLEYVMP